MARHGENIRKRKDGRWEGRYIKGRTDEGKAVWGSVYGSSYTQVRTLLVQRKGECAQFTARSNSLRFADLARMWQRSIFYGVKPSTYEHYAYSLRRYILPALGQYQIASLTEAKLEQGLLRAIRSREGSHKPLGYSLARECLILTRRICRYGSHLHLMPPLHPEIKLSPAPPKETAPLAEPDQQRLAQYVQEKPSTRKAGLLLASQMGLRIGEICGLQWRDFDLDSCTLSIRRTVQRILVGDGHSRVIVYTPKTRSSARQLPIPEPLAALLKQLQTSTCPGNAWFLSGRVDKPVEPRSYRKSMHCYLCKAGVRDVNPHLLRHTFATHCLQAGCDIKTLSELLGHADAHVTLQRYSHTSMERKRSEMNRIFGHF